VQDTAVPVRASVEDMVFGAVKDVHTSLPTDTILLKSDMFPTYHLASIVDDHEMGITHVIRGEVRVLTYDTHAAVHTFAGMAHISAVTPRSLCLLRAQAAHLRSSTSLAECRWHKNVEASRGCARPQPHSEPLTAGSNTQCSNISLGR